MRRSALRIFFSSSLYFLPDLPQQFCDIQLYLRTDFFKASELVSAFLPKDGGFLSSRIGSSFAGRYAVFNQEKEAFFRKSFKDEFQSLTDLFFREISEIEQISGFDEGGLFSLPGSQDVVGADVDLVGTSGSLPL